MLLVIFSSNLREKHAFIEFSEQDKSEHSHFSCQQQNNHEESITLMFHLETV